MAWGVMVSPTMTFPARRKNRGMGEDLPAETLVNQAGIAVVKMDENQAADYKGRQQKSQRHFRDRMQQPAPAAPGLDFDFQLRLPWPEMEIPASRSISMFSQLQNTSGKKRYWRIAAAES